MIEKTFLNPTTNKQWRIEIDGHTIRTCLNGGKVKEILCDSAFQVRSKAASAMMGQMRKGFVYQNRDAAVGQARCHRFVGKDSNGFMPLAASPARDDFFLTRVVGDFEDETLYHFDGSGESLETVSLGAKRMTYEQVLCSNDTLLLNNSYAWELGAQDADTGLIYLQSFAPDMDLQEFEERVCCVMENRMLVDVIDRALLRLKRYPDRGELYYEILTKQFIHRFNSTEKELLDELNMERSVFYDRKREAIFLLSLCLFGYAVPELQEELEMPRLYPD